MKKIKRASRRKSSVIVEYTSKGPKWRHRYKKGAIYEQKWLKRTIILRDKKTGEYIRKTHRVKRSLDAVRKYDTNPRYEFVRFIGFTHK